MPTIIVSDKRGDFSEDTRLVLAVEHLGVPIGHRCGGKARCTTCRVRFVSGEPDTMTRAEFVKLGLDREDAEKPDYRLACQILCYHDMELEVLVTLDNQGWKDTGPALDECVHPEAQWYAPDELRRELRG